MNPCPQSISIINQPCLAAAWFAKQILVDSAVGRSKRIRSRDKRVQFPNYTFASEKSDSSNRFHLSYLPIRQEALDNLTTKGSDHGAPAAFRNFALVLVIMSHRIFSPDRHC